MEAIAQNIKVTPDKIVSMLRQQQIEVSKEEAAKLLAFLKKLAKITVTKYLESDER
ncbi:hypothetical protein [Cyclobacterium sp.]|jgi:hypothetical protein|uniref:hypothetical protein n=1 Tax=Cyclobacterium sp. TaxID=1966343 RepID=UPI001994DF40|nr:hypothetical protein [Cyclobacterium sp.]MBD3630424.1 hypothetical protein [Cyclobacterium sp.]|tara:strand:- start:267 stop:434 length:168 start_codon:yes stop_codon:yes gene_type:complete